MVHDLSMKLSISLEEQHIIESSDIEIYAYGIELLLATGVNILIVFVESVLFHKWFAGILFLSGFIPLRTTAGGYHAKTHIGCCSVFIAIYSMCLLILCVLPKSYYLSIIFVTAIVSFLLVLLWAPMEAQGKPTSVNNKRRNRGRSIAICSIDLAIAIISIFVGTMYRWFILCYFLGVAATAYKWTSRFDGIITMHDGRAELNIHS